MSPVAGPSRFDIGAGRQSTLAAVALAGALAVSIAGCGSGAGQSAVSSASSAIKQKTS
jgi:hypothetical protein